jgi:hypothetical protein
MEQHIKVLATLNIVLGGLGICAALIDLIFFGGLAGVVSAQPDQDAEVGAAVLGLIGGIAFVLVAMISVPGLIAGIGLFNFRPWARTLALVVSAMNLFNIPFGTALGIYGFWVLMKDETTALIKAKNPA